MLCRSVLVISALCALGCSQAFAAGTEYLDRNNSFKVIVPDGWKKTVAETTDKIDAVLQSPRLDVTKGTCALAADPFVATRGMSQKQINDEMEPHINAAFWQSALAAGGAAQVVVENAGSELRNGRRIYTVTMSVTGKVEGVDKTAKLKATLQVAPDQIAMANCGAWAEHFALDETDIATVLDSFEALGSQVVAQRPVASEAMLLLFAGPRFDGPRKALTQDIPNLFQAGWNVPAASFALQGYGLWEVCDGMNYRGNCRLLAGAASAAGGPNYRPLRIGSARRVSFPNDPRNAIGLIASGVAAQAAETWHKLSKSRR
jgi:hypothetical protein